MATVKITDYWVLPDGLAPDDVNAHSFGVVVHWCGEYKGKEGGGWGVFRGGYNGPALSKSSRQWAMPERFRRWQYRWATHEEALAAAMDVVENGSRNEGPGWLTWKQWNERTSPKAEG